MSVRIQLLVRLRYMVIILFVRRHVDYLVGNPRILRIGFVNLAVRRLDEAILVDSRIGRQRVNKADVRSLRGLDGAHSSIMGIMHVADLEACAVSGQTARSQSGQTALVRQLAQRVVLIHELGQLRGSEELLHRSRHRLDVDQRLRRDIVLILRGHTLADRTLHSGKTDAVLVLQELAHRADTAVAQMVDIVVVSDAVLQMDVIVNGSNDIFLGNMLRNQLVNITLHGCLKLLRIGGFFQYFFQSRIIY